VTGVGLSCVNIKTDGNTAAPAACAARRHLCANGVCACPNNEVRCNACVPTPPATRRVRHLHHRVRPDAGLLAVGVHHHLRGYAHQLLHACVDLKSNNFNCGTCGRSARREYCTNGACTCATGFNCCAPGVCVDLKSNARNCGTCGNACQPGHLCVAGVCDNMCQPGQIMCGMGACADPLTTRRGVRIAARRRDCSRAPGCTGLQLHAAARLCRLVNRMRAVADTRLAVAASDAARGAFVADRRRAMPHMSGRAGTCCRTRRTHRCPAGSVAQVPQLRALLLRSTHTPGAHRLKPVAQVHAPLVQLLPPRTACRRCRS